MLDIISIVLDALIFFGLGVVLGYLKWGLIKNE